MFLELAHRGFDKGILFGKLLPQEPVIDDGYSVLDYDILGLGSADSAGLESDRVEHRDEAGSVQHELSEEE